MIEYVVGYTKNGRLVTETFWASDWGRARGIARSICKRYRWIALSRDEQQKPRRIVH